MVHARGVKFPDLVAAHAAFPSQRTQCFRLKKTDGAHAPSSPRSRRAPNLHSINRARTWRVRNQTNLTCTSSIASSPNNKSVSQRTALPVLITEPFFVLPVFAIIMTTLYLSLLSVFVKSLVSGGLRCVRERLALLTSTPPGPDRDRNFLHSTYASGGGVEDVSIKLCFKCSIIVKSNHL